MRPRASAVLVCLALLTSAAGAVVPRATPRIAGDTLTAMPSAGVAKPLRSQRDVRWSHPTTAAWQKLAATGAWQAAWDRATGVPNRIWGAGIPVPGASTSPGVAAAFARAMLAEHIALLAPGSSPADFVLVSNHFDGDIRSIGFVQRSGGRVVVGGQLSFRFKNDRLFMIGSEALPDVRLPEPRTRLSAALVRERAAVTLRRELVLPHAAVTLVGDEVVLPLVSDDAVLGYRIAVPVTLDGGADGRYLAYCDPATGDVLAVRQTNLYSTGTVLYRSVDRYPFPTTRPRIDRPAPLADVMVNGVGQTTTSAGVVTWPDTSPQLVVTAVVGTLVSVVNKSAGGGPASAQLTLAADGQIVWDASTRPDDDAQVQTYLAVNLAKDLARELDPSMPTLNAKITANVNMPQTCNAFYDGTSLNFFRASSECQNTGMLQDVVFHEFGHAVHDHEIIDGVGAFDGAMSEGVADFFAALITSDAGVGRGFFYTDGPLRDLDPPTSEARWPRDIGEIHKTGLIFGGTFWDLRKTLIAELGEAEGIALAKKLFLGTIRRSIGIPSSLLETLATDDDDGNLLNGTPHECAIRDAYARHGLRSATGVVVGPDRVTQPTAATTVQISVSGLAERCAGDVLTHAQLYWKRAGAAELAGELRATQSAPTEFFAELPLLPDKTLYQVKVFFQDSSVLTLPDNLGDAYYEVYQGRTMTLYCADFENGDPMAAGWSSRSTAGTLAPWSWGVPIGGSTDPHAAFSSSHIIAQVLNGDYPAKSSSFLKMPSIDIGQWSDVHLQYRRWLSVEDSHFDQARIRVGDKQAWVNFTQNIGDSSAAHHIDREWRFHDVVVSGYQMGHTVDIAWELTSDEGLEFGGWAIDDVCVVANVAGVCGDGAITANEECDDGANNADRANACRTWCKSAVCGDGIIDNNEECDGGPEHDNACTLQCTLVNPPDLGGCCSAQRNPAGSLLLAGVTLAFALRRRRRQPI